MKKKLTMVVSLLLVMALSIGGTLAYLTDKTEAIENTFTVGNVTISLAETKGASFKIVPGATVEKDPTITVEEGSEPCYVYAFIDNALILGEGDAAKVVAKPNVDTSKWTVVKDDVIGKSLYRYNEVLSAKGTADIFTTVKYDGEAITEENINKLDGKKITITAFAHQSANIDNVNVADSAAIAQFFPAP